MGIIRRQGIKKSLVSYVGVLLGALSVIFVYSNNKELYGLAQFLISSGLILTPFVLLGATTVPIKFFPDFKSEENGHNGLLTFVISISIVGSLVLAVLVLLFHNQIESVFIDDGDDPLLKRYFLFVFLIAILIACARILQNYTANFKRIVVPGIINGLWLKIALPTLILLATYGLIETTGYVWGLMFAYFLVIFGLLAYLKYLGELKLTDFRPFLDSKRFEKIRSYALFGLLGSLGANLTLRLDAIMIGKMVDMTNNGAYSMLVFFINTVEIPAVAITAISAPIISQAFENNNISEVDKVYRKSSITMLFVGLMLFSLIFLSIEDLVSLLPKSEEFVSVLPIIGLLGVARVINMATAMNTHIILYSKYFRFNLYVVLILGLSNIVFNYFFISEYGVVGAAVATFIALTFYNILKFSFIKYKLGIQPFTINSLWLLIISLICLAMTIMIPMNFHPIFNIVIKSVVFSLVYVPVILYLKLSEDINRLVKDIWHKVVGVS